MLQLHLAGDDSYGIIRYNDDPANQPDAGIDLCRGIWMSRYFSEKTSERREQLESLSDLGKRTPTISPDVTWKHLTRFAGAFYGEPSDATLSTLLANWQIYWNWSWNGNPPEMAYLLEIWQELVEHIEVKSPGTDEVLQFPESLGLIREVSGQSALATEAGQIEIPEFRLEQKRRAPELSFAIMTGLFPGRFTRIVNTELSHIGLVAEILRTPFEQEQMRQEALEMVLINRLYLALERYAYKLDMADWVGHDMDPPSYVVFIDRVQRSLGYYRRFEPETRPAWIEQVEPTS